MTTAQLSMLGVSAGMLSTQLRTGRLVRLRRGVFLAASAWPDDPAGRHLVRARAEQVSNPAAVLSHQSAAVQWGLPHPGPVPWHDLPVSLTLPSGGGHGSQAGLGVHHVAHLPDEQVARDEAGYPVTTIARTAVDLSRGLSLPEALVVLDGAARNLCEGYVVRARRSDFSNPRLADAARAELAAVAEHRPRTALTRAIDTANPARESAAESLSAGHFLLAGLPTPLFQPPVRTPFGVFFPDCYWPEANLIGECDGAVKYTDAEAYVKEKSREQIFRDLGCGVVRWLAREIMARPEVVVARVARALGL
jgi:hypothetical protein